MAIKIENTGTHIYRIAQPGHKAGNLHPGMNIILKKVDAAAVVFRSG